MGKWMIQAWVHSGLHSVDVAFFKCNEALDRAKQKSGGFVSPQRRYEDIVYNFVVITDDD